MSKITQSLGIYDRSTCEHESHKKKYFSTRFGKTYFPQKSCEMNLRKVKRAVIHAVNVIQVVLVGGLSVAGQSIGWRERVAAGRLSVCSQYSF